MATNLRVRMEAAGLTAKALADALRMHPAILDRVLNGEMEATGSEARVSEYLDGKEPGGKPAPAAAPSPFTRQGQAQIAREAAERFARVKADDDAARLARQKAYTEKVLAEQAERIRHGQEMRALRVEKAGLTIEQMSSFCQRDWSQTQRFEAGAPLGRGLAEYFTQQYELAAKLGQAPKGKGR